MRGEFGNVVLTTVFEIGHFLLFLYSDLLAWGGGLRRGGQERGIKTVETHRWHQVGHKPTILQGVHIVEPFKERYHFWRGQRLSLAREFRDISLAVMIGGIGER